MKPETALVRKTILRIAEGLWISCALTACDDPAGPNREEAKPQFVQVVAGDLHTCARRDDGAVFCWGANDGGQLGVGSGLSPSLPIHVNLPAPVQSIHASGRATCAIGAEGAAWCWGTLPNVVAAAPISMGAEIAWRSVLPAGDPSTSYVCGIDTEGVAYCWGEEPAPHLGTDSAVPASTPNPVAGGRRWQSIAARARGYLSATCGVTREAGGYCWGRVPGFNESAVPEAVSPDRKWSVLVPGQGFVCGITADGDVLPDEVHCWGTLGGELLDTLTRTGMPAQHIAVGRSHVCRVDRPWLSCWGANENGQLGLGNRDERSIGQHVATHIDWVDVAAGAAHTCGVTAAGEVWCWGSGERNQIGDGIPQDRLRPARVRFDQIE